MKLKTKQPLPIQHVFSDKGQRKAKRFARMVQKAEKERRRGQ